MKKLISIPISVLLLLTSATVTYAVCPICTVAVIAGLGLSRYLGVDDTVSGVWVGGVILSTSFWMSDWLKKRGVKIPYLTLISALAIYSIVFVPLWLGKIIGNPLNTLLGIDKLILGTFFGSTAFLIGVFADRYERKIKEKQLFIFQKVIFPVSALAIASLVFYFIVR